MSKKIIIISGDPNSINSEIIYKVWKKLSKNLKRRIYLISNYDLIKKQFAKLDYKTNILKVKNFRENPKDAKLKIIDLDLKFKNPFQVSKGSASKFIINSLNFAHKIALDQEILGIINCPIDKRLLNKKNIGVTEFLASKCKVKNNSEVMLIGNKNLFVCPITTHIDLKDVSKKLNKKSIISKIKTINLWFLKIFKKKPKIAVLGLNPHNAELRKNSEEKKIIIPSILKLKKLRININGPFVADTFFMNEYKKFDAIIGMYHDQVLTPYKSLNKFNAINITLGLKYLRVSPDHGIAFNLIGKNKADITSLMNCILFVNKFGK